MAKASSKTDITDNPVAPDEQLAEPAERKSLRRRFIHRYDRHMPDKKHHRMLIWAVFFVCSTVIGAQLLYPTDRALPLARVAGENVSWKNHDELAGMVTELFSSTEIELIVDDAKVKLPLASAGAELNTDRMIDQVLSYPFWQRFIPFSIFIHSDNISTVDVFYTGNILKEKSVQHAKELSFEPVNARLAIEGGKLIATSEKPGRTVTAEKVRTAITQSAPALGKSTVVMVPAEKVEPTETADSLRDVQVVAEAALARQVRIAADNHIFNPDNVIIASWLQLGTDEAGKTTLTVADDALAEYFNAIDTQAGTPAGRTNINLTNGRETSRTPGQTGRVIERDQLKTLITSWLLAGEGEGEFVATFRDVAPSIMYDNKYTATEEGLRAYVADAGKRMNVRIAIQQVDGGRWTASTRADESIPSASTYKLFVAKWLFDQMDKGLVRWDDPVLDTNVSTCFDRMTIASTNPCAESWLAQAGRANFNEYIWGLGFSRGTNFNMPVATQTTANDLQQMMLGIHDGTIMSGANKDRLLRSLSTHPYGYGIPTGSSGQVYDKVGFLWDYVHDTAIVKHPKGTYIMTIMTKGQSYATIASLTREIERIMYP